MAKILTGIVSASKADKTITVTTRTRKTHPLYRKQYTVSKKFLAHDEKNEARNGDKVEIVETRPLSAHKRHRLHRIVERPALREDSLAVTQTDETPKQKTAKPKDKANDEDPS